MKPRLLKFLQEFLGGILLGILIYMYFHVKKELQTFSPATILSFIFIPAFVFGTVSLLTTDSENHTNYHKTINTTKGQRKIKFCIGFLSGLFIGFFSFLVFSFYKGVLDFSLLMGLKWGIVVGPILGLIFALNKGELIDTKNSILSIILKTESKEIIEPALPSGAFSKFYGLLSLIFSLLSFLLLILGVNINYYLTSISIGVFFSVKSIQDKKSKQHSLSRLLGWLGFLIMIIGIMFIKDFYRN